MTKLRTAMIVAGSAAALLLPASGPAARNIRAKPDAAVCTTARAQGQILPGCPQPERAERDAQPAPPAPPPSSRSSQTPGAASRGR